jgi:polar amino acid transport system ATP-binding protein
VSQQQVELKVAKVHKHFGDLHVLKGVDMTVFVDEVVALIGPSGSGKSTLLRCLNLLEFPNKGEIYWKDEPVKYDHMSPKQLSEHRRRMGMVFQHFNLFPHMTAAQNVMEGPTQVLGTPKSEARERAQQLLDKVGLGEKADEYPDRLSGGQKQRVAIARALAMEPEALLLDEVTSALDIEMVAGINDLIAELAEQGMTMVTVTHDLGFARSVADRIFFMDHGEVVEQGPPDELLDNPQSDRLKEFLTAVQRA